MATIGDEAGEEGSTEPPRFEDLFTAEQHRLFGGA